MATGPLWAGRLLSHRDDHERQVFVLVRLAPTAPFLRQLRGEVLRVAPTRASSSHLSRAPVGLMANQDPKQDRQDRNVEESGESGAADIVGQTGE